MRSVVLHSPRPAQENRYDGPIPRPAAPPQSPSPLLGRLAAESRARLAARRRTLPAAALCRDNGLPRECADLTLYRMLALG